jgi:CBS domain containing-hemolysin-like protein
MPSPFAVTPLIDLPDLAVIPSLVSSTSVDIAARWLSILFLIAINAFFVIAEFSIVSVRRSRISQLVEAGDIQAKTVQELQSSIDRLLSTTQLGITLSSLALGWIGQASMAAVIQEWLTQVPWVGTWGEVTSHSLSIPIAFGLIAYLQIVLGELCPKSLALLYAEEIARFIAPLGVAIARLFNPFIWVLNQSTKLLLKLFGIRYTGQGWFNQVTPEELQLIIATSTESTGLEQEERDLLSNVFEFGAVSAGEVMIRRPNITAISFDATVGELLEEVARSRHSRYPVIDNSLDEVRGIIHLKDIAEPLVQGQLSLDGSIQAWIHPARFAPEYTPLAELLALMQRSRQHLVIVVDEFGGTAGLVTLQDLITQIIGETPDSDTAVENAIQWLDPATFVVQAQLDLEEVNKQLNLELPPSDEYQTLGGFLLYQWQRIPLEGETLQYGECELTVLSAEGPRLNEIRIHRIESVMPTPEST